MKTKTLTNDQVQTAFLKYDRETWVHNAKVACILLMILMPVGSFLDFFVYPTNLWYFFQLRIICSLLAVLGWWLFKTSFGQKNYQVLKILWYIQPGFFMCWMIAVSEGAVSPYYAGLNLLILAIYVVFHGNLKEDLTTFGLIISMYLGACFIHGSIENKGILFNNLYFLILTGIIAITGNYFYNRLRFQEFELRYKLDQSRKKLIEVDKLKNRFFANISHELRTPLTLLLAPLEKIRKEKNLHFDEETNDCLTIMYMNTLRLLKLINDLLDLVKLEEGKLEIKSTAINISFFIKGLISSIQGAINQKGLKFTSHIQEDISCVLADQDKLEKILLNLIFNAIKFTPKNGLVEIKILKKEETLLFKITDTGIGISEKDIPFIFDRFWQADTSMRRRYQGSGIGLSLVKELTEAHGGSISIDSQKNKGTTFTVKIPYKPAPLNLPQAKKSVELNENRSSNDWLESIYRKAEYSPFLTRPQKPLHFKNVRQNNRPEILIVDDAPDILRFIAYEMGREYTILEAVDGQEAINKATIHLPDLIILDMMMPKKDGIEVCKELKSDPSTENIPIILLTARADEQTKMRALFAGATDFITKPFSSAELYARVKNLIKTSHLQCKLTEQNQTLGNSLKEIKQMEIQLIQTEKLASLGRMSAGIIHEINNPLNFLSSILYVLGQKEKLLPKRNTLKYKENIQDMKDGLNRIQQIVSNLRTFAHPAPGQFATVKIYEIIETTLKLLSNQWKSHIAIKTHIDANHTVYGNKNLLIQVLLNLIQNAIDSVKLKHSDKLTAKILIQSQTKNNFLYLTIRDNGRGIDKKHIDKIFDPFFTTKKVGEGMGLGLSICYRLIQQHKGHIKINNAPQKFTEFSLELPINKKYPSKKLKEPHYEPTL